MARGLSSPGNVLVTGGAGFIGSHLVDRLIETGHRVHVIDSLETGNTANLHPSAELIEADIGDSVGGIVAKVAPKAVFHLAAQVSVAVSARDPELDARVNLMGTLNLLQALVALKSRPRFIFFSTGGGIYGDLGEEELPARESMDARPLSPYGASKLAVETYLRVYGHLHGIDYGIVRPSNVYGPRQDPHGEAGVIAIFAQAMLAGRQVTIFGDGEDVRDYIYVSDLVEGALAVYRSGRPGPYNLGTGTAVSVNQLHASLCELIPDHGGAVHGPPRPGDIPRIWLDVAAAEGDLGWRPGISLMEGMGRTVEWFRGGEPACLLGTDSTGSNTKGADL